MILKVVFSNKFDLLWAKMVLIFCYNEEHILIDEFD